MTTNTTANQLCSVTLLGNIVATPEIRYLANPILAITETTIATTHRWLDKKSGANKEWTSYHNVKAIGKIVEQALLHAKKGDVLLIQGYLANNKQSPTDIIHATHIEHFAKGFTHAINHINCSAVITSPVKLVTTEHNKQLATFDIQINHQVYSEQKQVMMSQQVTRSVHVWGKQATYLGHNASENDLVIIEGRVSYSSDQSRKQYVEATQIHLVKK